MNTATLQRNSTTTDESALRRMKTPMVRPTQWDRDAKANLGMPSAR